MKILLLNDNPVVTKLVTLSAQKTSDELEIVESVDEISEHNYDLFVIDDTLYTKEIMQEIKAKIKYIRSLYICSRDAEELEEFDATLKKPFLPTDLVELFATINKEVQTVDLDEDEDIKGEDLGNDLDLDLDLDEISLDDGETLDDEELDLDDLNDLNDLNDLDDLDLGDLDLEDLNETPIEEADMSLDDTEFSDSVLDKKEVQEVQELLDETESDVNLDDISKEDADTQELDEDDATDLDLDDLDLDLDADLDDLQVNEESMTEEEIADDELVLDDEAKIEPQDKDEDKGELDADSEMDAEDEIELDADSDIDAEDDIQSAVSELSEDELDMPISEIAGLDSLTQNDIKLAIGEEIEEDDILETDSALDMENGLDADDADDVDDEVIEGSSNENGVDVLKKLLKVLSDEGIASSLNGKKIEIKITIGDK